MFHSLVQAEVLELRIGDLRSSALVGALSAHIAISIAEKVLTYAGYLNCTCNLKPART